MRPGIAAAGAGGLGQGCGSALVGSKCWLHRAPWSDTRGGLSPDQGVVEVRRTLGSGHLSRWRGTDQAWEQLSGFVDPWPRRAGGLGTCGLPWGYLSKAGAPGQVQGHLSRLMDTWLYTTCGNMWPAIGTPGWGVGNKTGHWVMWPGMRTPGWECGDKVRYGDTWSGVWTHRYKARCGDTC